MAHRHPNYAFFTREVCRRGILQEPFRLIDVGVRGGIGEHWFNFGDHLEAWGFDVLDEEGVGPLIATNPHPERLHYLKIGLGDEDTIRAFRFYPENPSSSHFAASNNTDTVDGTWQNIQVRRLDTLYAQGVVGSVDFMKMDAETYEIEIVKGARQFLLQSGIFGIESETTFLRTTRNPRSHFVELYEALSPYGFAVYDVGAHRVPRQPLLHGFPEELEAGKYALRPIGRTSIFDFLFLNDLFDNPAAQSHIEVDQLIKMIAVAEIYCLQDLGLDILFANRERLGGRFDVDEAADWLVRLSSNTKLTYKDYMAATSTSANSEITGGEKIGAPIMYTEQKLLELKARLLEQERTFAAQVPELERIIAEQQSQLAEKAVSLAEKDAVLRAVFNSRSWRLTGPLRKLSGRLWR